MNLRKVSDKLITKQISIGRYCMRMFDFVLHTAEEKSVEEIQREQEVWLAVAAEHYEFVFRIIGT